MRIVQSVEVESKREPIGEMYAIVQSGGEVACPPGSRGRRDVLSSGALSRASRSAFPSTPSVAAAIRRRRCERVDRPVHSLVVRGAAKDAAS